MTSDPLGTNEIALYPFHPRTGTKGDINGTYVSWNGILPRFRNSRRSPIFYVILTALCTSQPSLSLRIVYHKMSRKLMGLPPPWRPELDGAWYLASSLLVPAFRPSPSIANVNKRDMSQAVRSFVCFVSTAALSTNVGDLSGTMIARPSPWCAETSLTRDAVCRVQEPPIQAFISDIGRRPVSVETVALTAQLSFSSVT